MSQLRKIDESNLADHRQLTENDHCYYLLEYTARAGFASGRTNDLISNIKKPEDRKDRPEYKWKIWALEQLAAELRGALPPSRVRGVTFVPVPPSRHKDDPLYDDRLLRLLRLYAGDEAMDIRELVAQVRSTDAARHLGGARMTGEELAHLYRVVEDSAIPEPSRIVVFDDVLTSGAHFKAMQSVLAARFPNAPIRGVFIARTIQP